jgi:predicted RNA-binding Zn-ribbon protein involved in translation (DUF1610 family)
VSKAADWLREERRKVLGDWVAVCPDCGFAQRYFEEWEDELPDACPACAGAMLARCPACAARFSSVFAVDCEVCGQALRRGDVQGVWIRRERGSRQGG